MVRDNSMPEIKEKEVWEREAHKILWKDINTLCKRCIESCKQSYLVKILACPNYRRKEEGDIS